MTFLQMRDKCERDIRIPQAVQGGVLWHQEVFCASALLKQ